MAPQSSDKSKRGGIAYRSKLLPYAQKIAVWQREGKTYREIADLLKEQHQLEIWPGTINDFVLVRARGVKRTLLPDEYLQAGEISQQIPMLETRSDGPALAASPKQPEHLQPTQQITPPPRKRPKPGMLPPQAAPWGRQANGDPNPPPPDPVQFRPENL